MPFHEIPILDLSLARDEATKPAFLQELLNALLNVGFLYIKNTGVDQALFDRVCKEGIQFFDLPDDEKLRIEMKNAKSFLGYSKVCFYPDMQTRQPLTIHPAGQRDHSVTGGLAGTA